MGRFSHEAVAFDPATGDAFLTEDRSDSLFYRFIPNQTGNLSKGKLFALSIEGHPQDTRNWKNRFYLKGVRYKVDGKDYMDVARSAKASNIFDLYFDTYGMGAVQSIDYGYGTVPPGQWGYKSPSKSKKRK